ncbi:hypothetical protein CMO86_02755 [Candidatus Woesearchaeota archaeon]|nr:hypothetical protein [Candidatus Woesearchaeota archaeon]
MAIELKNSMFIHVPKCGGRTVKQMLKKYVSGCKVLGDDIYESHATPDTSKQVFGFIRHPATFIHSLWTHRSKKKAHGSDWNWHPDIRMEQECKSKDYNTFVDNVLKGENYVLDYYMHYLGKYQNPMIGKMEELPNSLIKILKANNEDFDEKGIRENIYVHGANNRSTNRPISLVESINYDRLKRLITTAEKKLCKEFDYHAF